MAATTANPRKVITGEVRLSYAHLFEPYAQNPEQAAKYSTVILIPKSDKATINKIKAAIEAAKEEGKSRVWGGRIPPKVDITLHDGDEEGDLERNPEYAGHYYMSISSKQKPGLVDQDLNPILDQDELYSGCYVRVAMNAFAYLYNGKKGVSFGLNNVQKLRDGEPLGGRTRAEDDFDAVDREDDDLV